MLGLPSVVRQGGAHQQGRAGEALCKISRAEQCVAGSRIAGLALCGAEADQRLAARELIGDGLAVDELEGLAVPGHGVVGSEFGERVVTGAQGVLDRFAGVGRLAGLGPVVGEFAEAVAGIVAV